jgi:uncharacterized protein with NRDE domain
MCLIAWALQARDDVPLLIAANRDEAWDRPTLPLRRWTEHGGIPFWAGQDAREGGSWMGFGEGGRLAFLTNVREAHMPPAQRSRGELVTRWLASDISVQQLQAELNPADYGGFNLVLGDWHGGPWHWCSNRDPADPHRRHSAHAPVRWHTQAVAPGLGSLSNASLNTPWAKSQHLTASVQQALAQPKPHDSPKLTHALASRNTSPIWPDTGLPSEAENQLSSAFVHWPERRYGTRSSLIAAVQRRSSGWELVLQEWTHRVDGVEPVWGALSFQERHLSLGADPTGH